MGCWRRSARGMALCVALSVVPVLHRDAVAAMAEGTEDVFPFGNADYHGSTGDIPLSEPIVGMAATPPSPGTPRTPGAAGYWLVASDGGIFTFGDADFHGSAAVRAPYARMVEIAAPPSGDGYWLVSSVSAVLLAQLDETATQFPEVDRAVYSNGDVDAATPGRSAARPSTEMDEREPHHLADLS